MLWVRRLALSLSHLAALLDDCAAVPNVPSQIGFLDSLVFLNISGAEWNSNLTASWLQPGVFPHMVTLDARYNWNLQGVCVCWMFAIGVIELVRRPKQRADYDCRFSPRHLGDLHDQACLPLHGWWQPVR